MDCAWIFQFGWDTVYLLCPEGDASSESEDMKSVHTPTRGRMLIRSNVAMIGNTVWPFCWHHGFVPLFGLMSTEPRLGKKLQKQRTNFVKNNSDPWKSGGTVFPYNGEP